MMDMREAGFRPRPSHTAASSPGGHDRLSAEADRVIALIDEALTRQVNAILHHPRFQEMEARWLGLALLLRSSGNAPGVKIKLLSVSWPELSRNIERAAEFDQSRLFDLVYNQEFGMPGGEPFGLLVGDYMLSHKVGPDGSDPVGTLSALAGVAAAAFCPFIAGAAPQLLDLERFGDAGRVADLGRSSEGLSFARWQRLRDEEDTRFIGLAVPRVLMRAPHGSASRNRIDGFLFREEVRGPDHLLWGNAAFAFASVVIHRYLASGWFADIRGVPQDQEGGGQVAALAPYDIGTDGHGLSEQPPVEVRFSHVQEQQISELGLMPASTTFLSSKLVFNSNQSLHSAQRYHSPQASQNARLAAMLQYVLCASRFAHYLKVIMRDEIGRLADARSLQMKLEGWLTQYTLGNDDADSPLRARFPLRMAGVSVEDMAGRPGTFKCSVKLQPHFQLDDVSTSFHLLAETSAINSNQTARAVA